MRLKLLLAVCVTATTPLAAHAAELYVKANSLNVRLCPDGACPVKTRLEYGAKVTVFERKGEWARISAFHDAASEPIKSPKITDSKVARWVSAKFLSETKPPKRPKWNKALMDPRIKNMPKVGQDGLNAREIRMMRKYAVKLLQSGECNSIINADKSKRKKGTYFVICDNDYEPRFFTSADVR